MNYLTDTCSWLPLTVHKLYWASLFYVWCQDIVYFWNGCRSFYVEGYRGKHVSVNINERNLTYMWTFLALSNLKLITRMSIAYTPAGSKEIIEILT